MNNSNRRIHIGKNTGDGYFIYNLPNPIYPEPEPIPDVPVYDKHGNFRGMYLWAASGWSTFHPSAEEDNLSRWCQHLDNMGCIVQGQYIQYYKKPRSYTTYTRLNMDDTWDELSSVGLFPSCHYPPRVFYPNIRGIV